MPWSSNHTQQVVRDMLRSLQDRRAGGWGGGGVIVTVPSDAWMCSEKVSLMTSSEPGAGRPGAALGICRESRASQGGRGEGAATTGRPRAGRLGSRTAQAEAARIGMSITITITITSAITIAITIVVISLFNGI